MRTTIRLSILALSVVPLHAQTGSTDPGGVLSSLTVAQFAGSGSQSIQAMTSDAAGNVYVAGTTSSPDLPVKNAAQPVIGEALLLRSVDRGTTWQKLANPPAFPLTITPHPSDSQTLFVGCTDGIYKTVDGGQTWLHVYAWAPVNLSPGEDTFDIAIDPSKPLLIYAYTSFLAGSNSPVFLASADGGQTWQPRTLPKGVGFSGVRALWVDPNGSGTVGLGLSLSRDHGLTWTSITVPPAPPTQSLFFLVPDPKHTGWIYAETAAGTLGHLYLSTDWGTTWTERPSPMWYGNTATIFDLLFDPDLPGVLYAPNASLQMAVSEDNGATWQFLAGPANPFLDTGSVLVSRQCMGGAFLGVSNRKVVSSLDFGATWQPPQLNGVLDVAAGPGCAVYAARTIASDAFVAKLAPGGTEVLWSTFLGGLGLDASVAITLDTQGNVYVAGNTASADFPATVPRVGTQGQQNAFVAKFDPNGSLLYSTVIGGESTDTVTGLAVNAQGQAHVAGRTNSKSFPATPGAFQTQAGSSDGFAVKLAADGTLVYTSYLPNLAPPLGSPGIGNPNPLPSLVAVAAESGGSAWFGGNAGMLSRMSPDGSTLTALPKQTGQIYTMQTDTQGNIYVAGQTTAGARSASCFVGFADYTFSLYLPPGDIFVTKLQPDSLQQVYSARLSGACQSRPGALQIGPTGEVTLGLWNYSGFPVRNPVLPLPGCGLPGSAAVSRLSADGSSLLFSSYLDMCSQAPAVALAPDGSVYGVTQGYPYQTSGSAGVLKVPVAPPAGISIEGVFNAFSGFSGFATPGMLLTITGENLAPAVLDLGLDYKHPLPTQLGGVQILFDGVPAEMFHVAPDRLIAVVPALANGKTSVKVQVVSGAETATTFVLPTAFGNIGLLTHYFVNLPPAGSVDGNIMNADGTTDDAQHPAAPGSNVTLFATGLSGPGPFALLWNAPPAQNGFGLGPYPLYGTARLMPGFIDALYAIDFRIPDAPGQGVYLVPTPGVLTRVVISAGSSQVGVYVK